MADDPTDDLQAMSKLAARLTSAVFELRAADDALVALLAKYSDRLGVSPKQLLDEYHQLYKGMHERLLLHAEASDPAAAGLVDRRSIEDLESGPPSAS